MSKTVSGKKKNLGLLELIAIAIGGMAGGGIFTILGISVSLIGNLTPKTKDKVIENGFNSHRRPISRAS